ncbi:MAG TPA: site-specific DNA-methyltransferase [Candidatus Collinsella stercoripullorum]|nr:site-specific DNA-methyltransferase [Candidatus Collinsella stercoripullorum]
MEKLSHTTENILDENVKKLAELFPEVVTEVREPDGTLRHTIDVDAFKERVGDVAEGQRERYQFTWPGKREAKQEAYRQIDKCLRPCPEESVDWDTTGNLYIEGDNLDALKLLRNTYAGKVKMIYIDPPYNTGHDFIYDDDFARSKVDYDAESGDYDEEGGRLVANPESNGRFHSDWCSMMYPRLLLARDLLSSRGALFISIDDNELSSLLRMCEDVFGKGNQVATIPRQSRASVQNDTDISSSHEYLVVFAKNRRQENRRLKESNAVAWAKSDSFACYPKPSDPSRYSNPDNDPRGPWKADPFDAPNVRPNLTYPIINPDTGEQHLPPRGRHWRTMPDQYSKLLEDGRIVFGKDGRGRPQLKVFYEEKSAFGEVDNTWWDAQRITVNSTASKQLMRLFDGVQVFDTPKPVDLITNAMKLALPKKSNDIILDFFSGSAACADAVMQLNAEDGGNRKFIMVQLPEVCDEKSEAAKAGYKNICEIGKERIRRAGKKIAEEVEESNRQLKLGEESKKVPDIGFRVLKIDSSNFEDVSEVPQLITQGTLFDFADNLKPGRTSDDLLFQVLPQFQIPLSAKIETKSINGSTVFSVDSGRLAACFDRNVSTETIVAMAKMEPDYAVMRDASFSGDDAVSNFGELFKTYSPATITRVV